MREVGLLLKMSKDILCPTFKGERRELEVVALGGEEGRMGEGGTGEGGDEVMRRKEPFGFLFLGWGFSWVELTGGIERGREVPEEASEGTNIWAEEGGEGGDVDEGGRGMEVEGAEVARSEGELVGEVIGVVEGELKR
jgi:hypothetical protein